LFRFILLHILPGRLMLKRGQAFVLEPFAAEPSHRRRFRITDAALTDSRADKVTGRVTSAASHVNDDLIAYTAAIRYGLPQEFVARLRQA
jgi:hypothetical protein